MKNFPIHKQRCPTSLEEEDPIKIKILEGPIQVSFSRKNNLSWVWLLWISFQILLHGFHINPKHSGICHLMLFCLQLRLRLHKVVSNFFQESLSKKTLRHCPNAHNYFENRRGKEQAVDNDGWSFSDRKFECLEEKIFWTEHSLITSELLLIRNRSYWFFVWMM